MPKGIKYCTDLSCRARNGAKAHKCRQCGKEFVIKSAGVPAKVVQRQEPTGMNFKRIELSVSCVKTYDRETTRLWEDESGDYRIRKGTMLACGTAVVHDKPYAAMHRKVVTDFFSKEQRVTWELISRHRKLHTAEIACLKHKNGEVRRRDDLPQRRKRKSKGWMVKALN